MKTKNLNKIKFNDIFIIQSKKFKKKIYNINGLDTETIKGNSKILSYSTKLENGICFTNSLKDVINNLLDIKFNKSINFFYNIDYDFTALLKYINEIELFTMLIRGYPIIFNPTPKFIKKYKYVKEAITIKNKDINNNIYISYLRPRQFIISNKNYSNKFYDLAQFFNMSLYDASLRYLNICKFCRYDIGKNMYKEEVKYNKDKYKTEIKFLAKRNLIHKYKPKLLFFSNNIIECPKCNNEHTIIRKKYISDINFENELNIYDNNVQKYAIHDAYITKLLGIYLYDLFDKFKININKPLSKAYLSEQIYKQHNIFISKPVFNKKFYKYAINAMFGGHFEIFKKGFFEKHYSYDINSAFPYELTNQKSLFKALISFHKNINYNMLNEFDYGFLKCKIKSDLPINFIPLLHNINSHDIIIYPRGKFIQYLTIPHFKLLNRLCDVNIEILDGILIKCPYDVYPFKYLKELYDKRLEFKINENPLEYLIKIILNSTFGKTLQLTPLKKITPYNPKLINIVKFKDILTTSNKSYFINEILYKTGLLFNPAHSAYTTSGTRINLYNQILNNKKNKLTNINNILLFAVDGIKSTKKLNIINSDKLGKFKCEIKGTSNDKILIIGNGLYQENHICKHRGFKLNLNLIECLKHNRHKTKIKLTIKRRINWIGLDNYNDLNVIDYHDKHINLNSDLKRIWKYYNLTGEDFLENQFNSTPIHIKNV